MLTDNSFIGIFQGLYSKELISIINLLVDSLDTLHSMCNEDIKAISL